MEWKYGLNYIARSSESLNLFSVEPACVSEKLGTTSTFKALAHASPLSISLNRVLAKRHRDHS